MENWDNWIFLFLGLILAYLLDFTKPWVKSYFDKRKLSYRNKGIKLIRDEYETICQYKESHSTLAVESIRLLAAALIQLTLFIFMVGLFVISNSVLSFIMVGLIGGGVILDFLKVVTLINKVDSRGFEKYKENAIKKLIKLGGNPEDLDKEDQE